MWSNSASMAASTERPSRQSTRSHVKTGGTRHLPRRRRLRAAVRPGEAGVPCPGFLPKPRLHSLQNLCDSSLSSRLQVAHLIMTFLHHANLPRPRPRARRRPAHRRRPSLPLMLVPRCPWRRDLGWSWRAPTHFGFSRTAARGRRASTHYPEGLSRGRAGRGRLARPWP